MLLCPSFRPEAIAAARAAATPPLSLAVIRFLGNGADLDVLLEPIDTAPPVERPATAPRGAAANDPPAPRRLRARLFS